MSRLIRRMLPLAAVFAWRNRNQITDWYRGRKESDDTDSKTSKADGADHLAPVAQADDEQL